MSTASSTSPGARSPKADRASSTTPCSPGIARAHDRSVAQIALRRLIQREIVVIPKSVRPARMAENLDVFDFRLTDDEMTRIAGLDTGRSHIFDHHDPEKVTWLGGVRFDT